MDTNLFTSSINSQNLAQAMNQPVTNSVGEQKNDKEEEEEKFEETVKKVKREVETQLTATSQQTGKRKKSHDSRVSNNNNNNNCLTSAIVDPYVEKDLDNETYYLVSGLNQFSLPKNYISWMSEPWLKSDAKEIKEKKIVVLEPNGTEISSSVMHAFICGLGYSAHKAQMEAQANQLQQMSLKMTINVLQMADRYHNEILAQYCSEQIQKEMVKEPAHLFTYLDYAVQPFFRETWIKTLYKIIPTKEELATTEHGGEEEKSRFQSFLGSFCEVLDQIECDAQTEKKEDPKENSNTVVTNHRLKFLRLALDRYLLYINESGQKEVDSKIARSVILLNAPFLRYTPYLRTFASHYILESDKQEKAFPFVDIMRTFLVSENQKLLDDIDICILTQTSMLMKHSLLVIKAQLQERIIDQAGAIVTLERACSYFSYSATLYAELGLLYGDEEHDEKALSALNKALEIDSNCLIARYRRCLLYTRLNQFEEAFKDFDRLRNFLMQTDYLLQSHIMAASEISTLIWKDIPHECKEPGKYTTNPQEIFGHSLIQVMRFVYHKFIVRCIKKKEWDQLFALLEEYEKIVKKVETERQENSPMTRLLYAIKLVTKIARHMELEQWSDAIATCTILADKWGIDGIECSEIKVNLTQKKEVLRSFEQFLTTFRTTHLPPICQLNARQFFDKNVFQIMTQPFRYDDIKDLLKSAMKVLNSDVTK